MTEHLHTESCYINDVLVCRQKAHTHSNNCYPLLLADNDINLLLTQIAATRDRNLESLLRSGSSITFGSGSSVRNALLCSRSRSCSGWNYTYAPIDFYTLTLDYSAADGGNSFRYVESGLGYTLPTLNGCHWEDADGNIITDVTVTGQTTVYARPDTCTVTYYVNGMEYARDEGLIPNTAYALRDTPSGWEGWRGSDGVVRKNGTRMTLTGSMTFHAVKYVTATFLHLDGETSTQQVLQGDTLKLPDGYWMDAAGTSYTGGSAVTILEDTTFTQTSGPPLTVTYTVNWVTPSGLNAPSTLPNIVGAGSYTVAAGTSHTISRVSSRTLTCTFRDVPSRYGVRSLPPSR